jgi:hypothetical protein
LLLLNPHPLHIRGDITNDTDADISIDGNTTYITIC